MPDVIFGFKPYGVGSGESPPPVYKKHNVSFKTVCNDRKIAKFITVPGIFPENNILHFSYVHTDNSLMTKNVVFLIFAMYYCM